MYQIHQVGVGSFVEHLDETLEALVGADLLLCW